MKRRKAAVRHSRRAVSYFRAPKRRSSRKGSSIKMLQIDSMLYGAVRGYLSNLLAPLTSKIPLGGIADEVGAGVLDYFVAKNTSGMIRDVALKGLTIENAMLGAGIVSGGLNTGAAVQIAQRAFNY